MALSQLAHRSPAASWLQPAGLARPLWRPVLAVAPGLVQRGGSDKLGRRGFFGFPSSSAGMSFSPIQRGKMNLGVFVVPEKSAYVMERLGKFYDVLRPGIHVYMPFVFRIAYVHSMKETAVPVAHQSAITRDNVSLSIDGKVYLKIVDAERASYAMDDAIHEATALAQTTMRSEIGKIELDQTFQERDALSEKIKVVIDTAAEQWGIECLRYEIRDIEISDPKVKSSMDRQAEAERMKRAEIKLSEGSREAAVNVAEGRKQATVLEAQAHKIKLELQAQGEATAILARAEATANSVELLAAAMLRDGSKDAIALRVAEQYVTSFGAIAKEGNTVIIPANAADASGMVASALSIFNQLTPTALAPPPLERVTAEPAAEALALPNAGVGAAAGATALK